MKKLLITVGVLCFVSLFFTEEENVVIPKEAIRFRIIANSDIKEDQELKKKVKKNLQSDLLEIMKESNSLEDSRKIINKNMTKLENNIETSLVGENVSYNIDYGMHYFPEKVYNGVTYPEGEYESLVVKLGDGLGENFWCVLFPPLCLLEAEEEDTKNVEYKSFVKEMLDKYF